MKKTTLPPLPPMLRKSDLKRPGKITAFSFRDDLTKYGIDSWSDTIIEMWFVPRFGWVIPTLLIRKAMSVSQYANRTYATTLGGQQCRIGLGPHVTAQIRVWISKRNIKRLMPLIELRRSGRVKSNETRDRISTRRMRRDLW